MSINHRGVITRLVILALLFAEGCSAPPTKEEVSNTVSVQPTVMAAPVIDEIANMGDVETQVNAGTVTTVTTIDVDKGVYNETFQVQRTTNETGESLVVISNSQGEIEYSYISSAGVQPYDIFEYAKGIMIDWLGASEQKYGFSKDLTTLSPERANTLVQVQRAGNTYEFDGDNVLNKQIAGNLNILMGTAGSYIAQLDLVSKNITIRPFGSTAMGMYGAGDPLEIIVEVENLEDANAIQTKLLDGDVQEVLINSLGFDQFDADSYVIYIAGKGETLYGVSKSCRQAQQ